MKVQLDFLRLPSITNIVGSAQKLDFEGSTIEDIVAHLIKRYGAVVENILVDERKKLNYYILVMVNDELIGGQDDREQVR